MRREFGDEFVSKQGSGRTGNLILRVPRLNNQAIPIEVRDNNMRFLGHAMTEQPLRLNEGQYVIRAKLPDGSADSTVINVSASDRVRELKLNWKPKRFFVSQIDTQKQALKTIRDTTSERPEHGWFMRFITFANGRWQPATYPPEPELLDCEVKAGLSATTMLLHSRSSGVYFMEVCKTGGEPLSMALPIAADTAAETCQVLIGDDGYVLETNGLLVGSPAAELITEYMETEAFQEVTEVMTDAEEMLYAKMVNPIEAALGGFALLRIGNLERLHNWPGNLANSFGWLPDGAIIAGEQAARNEDHAAAADYLLTAVARGLPIFYEGFSTLLSRLRQYTLYGSELLPGDSQYKHIASALQDVSMWRYAVDPSNFLLTIKGMSPLAEEGPSPVPRSEDGWRKFMTTPEDTNDRRRYWTSSY